MSCIFDVVPSWKGQPLQSCPHWHLVIDFISILGGKTTGKNYYTKMENVFNKERTIRLTDWVLIYLQSVQYNIYMFHTFQYNHYNTYTSFQYWQEKLRWNRDYNYAGTEITITITSKNVVLNYNYAGTLRRNRNYNLLLLVPPFKRWLSALFQYREDSLHREN